MDLLKATVAELERRGSATYAAGVSARMKQADPTFDVRNCGFATFKSFLAHAVEEGVVRVSRRSGASDFTVTGVDTPAVAGEEVVPSGRYLRQEAWAAFTRIEAASSWWQRDSGRIVGPMSDQPDDGSEWVELRPLTRAELTSWMRAFAEGVQDPTRNAELLASLDTASSVENFNAQVRSHQGTARRWGRFYRDHVMRHAFRWAEDNSVPRERLFRAGDGGERPSPPAALSDKLREGPGDTHGDDLANYESRARAAVISAVERMPLAELLRLPIPVEYLIRR
ncbi:hypothetical protein KM427_01005 [Nocardioides sp. LMS-CY]|uniref:UPF0158 family protein n=1 Tax=Nocardioides sp. (strain LMS-CY) TaxID=2840457 RepID=UPI001BFFE3A6|nr:UPF0158 family protein [Nocardioides sp. LMS-CY]QWF22366.1 hypothetical protein KM427_01005 [Nocardioides sp. LMS-CY]